MVRLDVLDDEIVGSSAAESFFKICEPRLGEVFVNGIEHSNFLVLDEIRVVSHSVRNVILSLKEVELVVVYSYVEDIVCYIFHIMYLVSVKQLLGGSCLSCLSCGLLSCEVLLGKVSDNVSCLDENVIALLLVDVCGLVGISVSVCIRIID